MGCGSQSAPHAAPRTLTAQDLGEFEDNVVTAHTAAHVKDPKSSAAGLNGVSMRVELG